MTTRPRYAVGIVSLLAACVGSNGGTDRAVVRDSAGVRIVENPASDPGVTWFVSEGPIVDIGGTDDQDLYQIVSAVRLSDGRIVVANRGTSELRYYSADGAFLTAAGRDGEGPGEFQRIAYLGRRPADSLVVYDAQLLRFAILDAAGTFVRSFRLETTDSVRFASVRGMYGDGSFLATGFADVGGATPDGLQRYGSPLYHFGPDGDFRAALGMFSGNETFYAPVGNGGFRVYEAFFPLSTYRIAVGQHLYLAANDHYEIRQYTPDGGLVGLIRRSHEPRPVTGEHLRHEREQRLAGAAEGRREQLQDALDNIPVPEVFPAYRWVRGDELGYLWVQEYPIPPAAATRWTVFDSSGVMRATVELPEGFDPTAFGDDYVLGTWRDDLDVEHVRVYGLERSP